MRTEFDEIYENNIQDNPSLAEAIHLATDGTGGIR